ncbi:MAG: hypothetical protein APF76_05360 [Desulfitibacter sp. BRH_c19]|nr:MAG: hypothetical protein APF76_05360 [Desulfitibacter sp. BRH_c19]
MESSKIVITVVGKDRVGIIAAVTGVLADTHVNILDISQTIMQNFFTMILVADTNSTKIDYSDLLIRLEDTGNELGVKITVQREDVFNYMHRI